MRKLIKSVANLVFYGTALGIVVPTSATMLAFGYAYSAVHDVVTGKFKDGDVHAMNLAVKMAVKAGYALAMGENIDVILDDLNKTIEEDENGGEGYYDGPHIVYEDNSGETSGESDQKEDWRTTAEYFH